jgi:hypothetical protein
VRFHFSSSGHISSKYWTQLCATVYLTIVHWCSALMILWWQTKTTYLWDSLTHVRSNNNINSNIKNIWLVEIFRYNCVWIWKFNAGSETFVNYRIDIKATHKYTNMYGNIKAIDIKTSMLIIYIFGSHDSGFLQEYIINARYKATPLHRDLWRYIGDGGK